MLRSNWNQRSFTTNGNLYGLRAMPASGFGKPRKPVIQTGYHKQLPLAEMKLRAWQVANGIEPVDTSKLIQTWMRDHGF